MLLKGPAVSELPHRNETEQAAIRNDAYRLWDEAGRPDGLALKFWLDAEAKLEAESKISVKPIALPLVITFTAANPAPTWPQAKVICPVPGSTADIKFFELTSTEGQYASPELDVNPGLLAHDYRLTLLQGAAATAAFDRIARLVAWFVDQDKPDELFLIQDPRDHSFYLAPEYFQALFRPQTYREKIAEIDSVLKNYPYAGAVTFDLELISLGSNVTFKGRLKTVARHALAAFLFLTSPAEAQAGTRIIVPVAEGAISALAEEAVKGSIEFFRSDRTPQNESRQEYQPMPENESRQELRRKLVADMSVGGAKGVMAVQRALQQLGLYDGPIDGNPGSRTRQGVEVLTERHHIRNDYPGGPVAISRLAADVSEKTFP